MREPYIADLDFTLYLGDALEVLRELPDESVDCALTSPPFYALRDYGVENQIGLEASPEEWCCRLVAVFAEVRRILRSTGTLWVECGDSYNSATSTSRSASTLEGSHGYWANPLIKHWINVDGIKAKDLLGTPWLLAFALRADGWWLRQAIIWHKPNAMPESATDRCTTNHSYIFLFSKQARYHFDAHAIAEPAEWARWGDQTVPKYEGTATKTGWMEPKTKAELKLKASVHRASIPGGRSLQEEPSVTRNARSVWEIPTQPYPEAHFATWPEALVERILKAGCPEQVCIECGKPRERLTEKRATGRLRDRSKAGLGVAVSREPHGLQAVDGTFQEGIVYETLGWSDCGCGAGFTSGVVLDPFLGSGTTALVARRFGRRCIGIELSEEYARLAAKRLQQQSLFA